MFTKYTMVLPKKLRVTDEQLQGKVKEEAAKNGIKLPEVAPQNERACIFLGEANVIQERKLVHRFEAGRCSCDDQWRWEERERPADGTRWR